ncbi:transglycosylase domain-containing protein [Bacillaceae bacterium S4-13-58]
MKNNRENGTFKDKLFNAWKMGKIQKYSRISYDVLWNVILFFIILGLIGGFFGLGVGSGYFASLVKDEPLRSPEDMRKSIYNYEETTDVYFADGIYLGQLRSDLYREEIKLEDVSEHLKNAVIATEDEYFNEHYGVVPKAILRALFQEATNSSVKSGGSTLTQQLIKNQILTNEVSFERKAKEILLALRLEQFFEKDEILEAYLNVIPYGRNSSGQNVAGIKAAATGIFDVEPKDLNLAQAAYIAGLPQSPFYYTPFTNQKTLKDEAGLEPGLDRMKTVLSRMLDAGYITQKEYDEALNYDIVSDFADPKPTPKDNYPWLTDEIEKRATEVLSVVLAKKDGYSEEDLDTNEELREQYLILAKRNLHQNGYEIHTTINKDIYDTMQQVAQNYTLYGPEKRENIIDPKTGEVVDSKLESVEVGSMLIENNTGKILGFVGGRDFEKSQFNHATNAERDIGSTMKPLLVYAPAMEFGVVQPGSVIADVKTDFNDGTGKLWSPKNVDLRTHGLTSVRNALAHSHNIPAAVVYSQIIDKSPGQFIRKMGIDQFSEDHEQLLSSALGQGAGGITIEDLTNAYATFGNMGKYVEGYIIEEIKDREGNIIYEHQTEAIDVFTEQTAYLTVDMMRDVIEYGTGAAANRYLKYTNVDWAGKSGTSSNRENVWFVATNPNVTLATWTGYDTPKKLDEYYNGVHYSTRRAMLWAEMVNAVSDIHPEKIVTNERFRQPGGLARRSYCAVSGLSPSPLCEELGLVQSDLYNAKFVPTEQDNSLLETRVVTIGENTYVASENTPPEFTEEGIYLNPEFLKEKGYDKLENMNELFPTREGSWAKIALPSTEDVPDDGKAPSAPTSVKMNGDMITWNASPAEDVIGYRVYTKSSETYSVIGSTKGTELKIQNPNQQFVIVAVDYLGNESGYSSVVGKEPPKDEEPDDPPEGDGNGNGNGGNDDNGGDNPEEPSPPEEGDGDGDTQIPPPNIEN